MTKHAISTPHVELMGTRPLIWRRIRLDGITHPIQWQFLGNGTESTAALKEERHCLLMAGTHRTLV